MIIFLCIGINILQLYFKISNLFSFAATVKSQVSQQAPSLIKQFQDKIQKLQSQLRYHPSQQQQADIQTQIQKYKKYINLQQAINSPEGQAVMQQAQQVQQYYQQQQQQQQNQQTLDWINSINNIVSSQPKRIKPTR